MEFPPPSFNLKNTKRGNFNSTGMNTLHSKYGYSFVFMPDLMERVRIELIQMGLVDRLVCLEDRHV